MKRFALIGHPVAASQSPRLFAAAYDGRYPYDLVDEERFEDAWQRFLSGYEGINVTAPFKRDAFNQVDLLSERARRSGAVNLVVRTPEGLKGYNTDVAGVTEALRECGLPVSNALVIGTGGAARAAAVGAQELGCRVTLAGRSPEKGEALARELDATFVPLSQVADLTPDLVLYTLPGSVPVPAGLPLAGAVVLEAEYKHPQLADATCRAYVSGLRWLLYQAVAGYELFIGEAPDTQKMAALF